MIISDPSDPSKIGLDGVEKLCNDLELDPVSKTMLVTHVKNSISVFYYSPRSLLATKGSNAVRVFTERVLRGHGEFTR